MTTKKDLARLIYPEFRFGKTSIGQGLELVKAGVGGFCFYGGTAEEVRNAAKTLKSASDHSLLIAADYEEGVGRRVRGMTELPANMALGAVADDRLAKEFAYNKGLITGRETVSLGLDWVFAPVLDLAVNADNPIVSLRSFGADAERTAMLAAEYCKGLADGGALSSIKHFPGHGRTDTDSHLALPRLDVPEDLLERTDMLPFNRLKDIADSIMAGHLLALPLDSEYPASLSEKIITGIIRRKMGFNKVIITDALNMNALNDWGEPGILALSAGADILLYPGAPFALIEALEKAICDGTIPESRVLEALERQESLVRHSEFIKENAKKRSDYAEIAPSEYNKTIATHSITHICGEKCLENGGTVMYFEPCNTFESRQGRFFTDSLARYGINAIPYDENSSNLGKIPLVCGIFTGPQAYSGKINLPSEQKKALERALSKNRDNFVISFGSPFALNGLNPAPRNAFVAYGQLPQFQECCAEILVGKAKAMGRRPC